MRPLRATGGGAADISEARNLEEVRRVGERVWETSGGRNPPAAGGAMRRPGGLAPGGGRD